MKKAQAGNADKDKQLKIMTDQNAELLRLLETEEAQTAKISSEVIYFIFSFSLSLYLIVFVFSFIRTKPFERS